jgi:hypothetical protein
VKRSGRAAPKATFLDVAAPLVDTLLGATLEPDAGSKGGARTYTLTPKPERQKPESRYDDVFYGCADRRRLSRKELHAWLRRAAALAYDRAETGLRRAAHVPVEIEQLFALR